MEGVSVEMLSEVAKRFHSLMENTDDRNAIWFNAKVDGMPTDIGTPVPSADVTAILRHVRCFCRAYTSPFDRRHVTQGLFKSPLPDGVVKNLIEIPLCSRGKAIRERFSLSHRAVCACGG